MKHVSAAGICVLCAAISTGCGRGATDDAELDAQRSNAGQVALGDDPISVTGCLTAEDDRFMLTRLDDSATPVATTEIYELDGDADDLRQHVGTMIQVFGDAPPATVAQVEQAPPTVGTAGQADTSAGVSVRETTRFETRELDVISMTPTGQSCPSAQSGEATR